MRIRPVDTFVQRGVFILCRTSNPGAGDIQDTLVSDKGDGHHPLYQSVAIKAMEWNKHGNVGLVVGATYPQELEKVRTLCPDMPFLIPGIGSQDGDLEQSVRLGINGMGRRALLNSSRGIIYASRGYDFADAARGATLSLRDTINNILALEGCGW